MADGRSCRVTEVRKRKRGRSAPAVREEDDRRQKKQTIRPNYFISLPITNTQVKCAVREVQEQLVQQEPRLCQALVPVDTLHITLLVTHLNTQQRVTEAGAVLQALSSSLTLLMENRPLVLTLGGVGHFRQEVAFVQVADGSHRRTLELMADLLWETFEEKKLVSGNNKSFKPHLTFLKLSRAPQLRRQGVKKLSLSLLCGFEGRVFGDERVCRLDLCCMMKKKRPDGYYHCETSLTLDLLHGRQHDAHTRCVLDDEELASVSKRVVQDAVSRAVQQYMEESQHNGSTHKDK